MTTMHPDYFDLIVDEQTIPLLESDPSNFLYEITGRIVEDPDLTGPDEELLVGRFRLYLADFEQAMAAGASPEDVLDAYSHTAEFADVVLDHNGRPFSRRLSALVNDDYTRWNLLIFDRLEILPAYRGHGIGLFALRGLFQRYALSAGIVALKVFPLQFEPEPLSDEELQWWRQMQQEAATHDRAAAFRNLKRYYRRLGFKPMPQTDFMFMPANKTMPTPETLAGYHKKTARNRRAPTE